MALEDLKLSQNRIENIDTYNIMNNFNHLEDLDFSHNKITSFDFLLILFTEKIDFINFDLLHFYATFFNDRIFIKKLILSNNLVENVTNEVFEKVYYLTYLDMNSNSIKNINSDSFKYTPNLEYVDLSQNKIAKLNKTIFNATVIQPSKHFCQK